MFNSSDTVLDFFYSGDVTGFRAAKHHMDKEEIWHDGDFICAQISEWLDDYGIDCDRNELPFEQREILFEIAGILGPLKIIFWLHPSRLPVFNDEVLVKRLLDQLNDAEDEQMVGRIEKCFEWHQYKIGFVLVNFYLHNLRGTRKPELKLTAQGLYNVFEAAGRLRIFNEEYDIDLAELELMEMLVETGYIHNILYLTKHKKLTPSASFYRTLARLPAETKEKIEQFHRLPKSA
ncbi:hypothetical protein [Pseudomonas fluorescens]|uniref:Uncharacterized protein n=1 Tax=Pseudomonas fluorescens TaxID=294 RepID=A0A0F4VEL4_PSEFL|nr:hypothetical protein [Pseudomonas fluorescens]KJZ67258.1 hypothetical protein VD17_03080 [Pseudomonas fluorescens]